MLIDAVRMQDTYHMLHAYDPSARFQFLSQLFHQEAYAHTLLTAWICRAGLAFGRMGRQGFFHPSVNAPTVISTFYQGSRLVLSGESIFLFVSFSVSSYQSDMIFNTHGGRSVPK